MHIRAIDALISACVSRTIRIKRSAEMFVCNLKFTGLIAHILLAEVGATYPPPPLAYLHPAKCVPLAGVGTSSAMRRVRFYPGGIVELVNVSSFMMRSNREWNCFEQKLKAQLGTRLFG